MAGGFWQGMTDAARIIGNGATFSYADEVAELLGNTSAKADTAAAYKRAGVAGDALYVGSALVGGPVGLGGRALLAGARAAKAALPTLPKFIPGVVRRNPGKTALSVAGLGIGLPIRHNIRTEGEAAAGPVASPRPAAREVAASPASSPRRSYETADKVTAGIMADLAGPSGPPTFQSMAEQVAAGQGGGISMRQMIALADIADKIEPSASASRGPKVGDAAGAILEQEYLDRYQRALADPRVDPDAAANEFRTRVLELRKSSYIDPLEAYRNDGPVR